MFLISSKAEVEALYTLTLAPFLSKHLAVARPIPCAAPVIRATLFSSMMTRSVHWATGLLLPPYSGPSMWKRVDR